jgi:hypothetical protein
MKLPVALTAVSLIALSAAGAGVGRLYAESNSGQAASEIISEQISGGPTAHQDDQMSEHGLEAMNDIYLARIAVNDGHIDNAKKLLHDAKSLLQQVRADNEPVTVTTEVKVGDKPVEKETVTQAPDLIPILAELQLVEGFVAADDVGANTNTATARAAGTSKPGSPTADNRHDAAGTSSSQPAAAAQPTKDERAIAVQQAQQQLQRGERQAAIETLRLVDLGLVSRVVSMPLSETSSHVDKAMSLIDEGKLHDANLELKQAKDGLFVATDIALEPADAAVPSTDTGKDAAKHAPKPDKAG